MKISKRFNKFKINKFKKSKKKPGNQGAMHASRRAAAARSASSSASKPSFTSVYKGTSGRSEDYRQQQKRIEDELLENRPLFLEKNNANSLLLNEARKKKRLELLKQKSKELELHNMIKCLIEELVFSYNYQDILEIFSFYQDIDFDKCIDEIINLNNNIPDILKEKLENAYKYFPFLFSDLDYKFDEEKKTYVLVDKQKFIRYFGDNLKSNYIDSFKKNTLIFYFEIFLNELLDHINTINESVDKHIKLLNCLIKRDIEIPNYKSLSPNQHITMQEYIKKNIEININYWTIENMKDIDFELEFKITIILQNKSDFLKIKEYVSNFKDFNEICKNDRWFLILLDKIYQKYNDNSEHIIEIINNAQRLFLFYTKIKNYIDFENKSALNSFEKLIKKILMKLFRLYKNNKQEISNIIYEVSRIFSNDPNNRTGNLSHILDINNPTFNLIHLDAILQIFKPDEITYDILKEIIECPPIYNNDYVAFIIDTIKSTVFLSLKFNYMKDYNFIEMNMFESCLVCHKNQPEFTINTHRLNSYIKKYYLSKNQKETIKSNYWLLGLPNKWKKYKKKFAFFGRDTEEQIFDEKKMNQTINGLEEYKKKELFRYIFTNLNINILNLYEDYHFPYNELVKHKEDFIKLQEHIYENRIYFMNDLNIPFDSNIENQIDFLKYMDRLNEYHQIQNEFIKNKTDYVAEFLAKYPN
jgi:hypothetical protein